MSTRRITKKIEKELLAKNLTDSQRAFIHSLLYFQKKYPQLSQKQWDSFLKIYREING